MKTSRGREACRRYYYSHNTGLQPQSVLYSQHSLDAQAQEFLDPNKWSSDGTVALCDYAFSKDGSLLAYSTGRWVLQAPAGPPHILPPLNACGTATLR